MSSVGIGQLKAKLSSYIEKVRHGEQVVITDHGEEVALLGPISRERRVIKSLVESGRAQWSGGKPKGLEGVAVRGKPLSETILDERQ
ncbi:MAG TPA: type II toxin-antitoxin system prevent-host-death family antitoxin [Nitrospiraceae bacterium]|nr:type II toxin-antitoxin system prevent-host-death family antitoxin [Nitrospiraceae bacterium]